MANCVETQSDFPVRKGAHGRWLRDSFTLFKTWNLESQSLSHLFWGCHASTKNQNNNRKKPPPPPSLESFFLGLPRQQKIKHHKRQTHLHLAPILRFHGSGSPGVPDGCERTLPIHPQSWAANRRGSSFFRGTRPPGVHFRCPLKPRKKRGTSSKTDTPSAMFKAEPTLKLRLCLEPQSHPKPLASKEETSGGTHLRCIRPAWNASVTRSPG